ncbi:hypothetical protein CAPTEDRAFT_221568 [Capitella teleta]|uniref:Aminoglycoside phosphotransferase domain-containing protein n=1 Tax=Capitella teleta TaxID=283909 RepID=R7V9N5_CAPTE|nr:hypothetical protein CAPTEDRAFT_221568 [Capitella teleta]|eukprot:ELU15294.1 hypothetical protein CAPTEDRAFT_221568 [Capitella teleta]
MSLLEADVLGVISQCQQPFVKELLVEGNLSSEDIGDGNLNDIIRVKSAQRSLIAKRFPPFTRCLGPEHWLDPRRSIYECQSLEDMNRICPGCVPQVYACDNDKHIICMEDLSNYAVLRKELIAGRVDKVAVQRIAEHIGAVHNATHVYNMEASSFQDLVKRYSGNPLVELTRNIIFVAPFDPDNSANVIQPEVKVLAESDIYRNGLILEEVHHLMQIFVSKQECLVHGDLHTGSIMVNNGTAKIFDNEFSYIGPASFDLGMLIANYFICYYAQMLTPEDNDLRRQVSYKMIEACRKTSEFYFANFCPNVPDLETFTADLISEAAGFCAIELFRRMMGVAHVEDTRHNGSIELEIVQCAQRLIHAYRRIRDIDRLLIIGLTLC